MGWVEDTYSKGGGVALDRGELVNKLEGVREVEEELREFREVFDVGGMGRRRAVPSGGELCCEAV
jgi:hypothetical protein